MDFINVPFSRQVQIKEKGERLESISSISFEDVYFKYPHSENEVLSGVSFTIHKGEKVALVGENGAGKTTLVKLILGLYKPAKGRILINNIDIEKIHKEDLYKLFSCCFQDFYTYPYSIRENIGFGQIERMDNDKLILQAAQKSGFDKVIATADRGIDHYINREFSEDGLVLSGGQAQKMALARAFMGKGEFVVLDEPSASLDVKTEFEIFEGALNLIKGKAVIYITHRLANVVSADKILLIKDGIIYEQGSHMELMKHKGEYSKLFELQAIRYILHEPQIEVG